MNTFETLPRFKRDFLAVACGVLLGLLFCFLHPNPKPALIPHATNIVESAYSYKNKFSANKSDKFDLKNLSPTQQALYGAFRTGYIVGANGRTEADCQRLFLEILNGNVNALVDEPVTKEEP